MRAIRGAPLGTGEEHVLEVGSAASSDDAGEIQWLSRNSGASSGRGAGDTESSSSSSATDE